MTSNASASDAPGSSAATREQLWQLWHAVNDALVEYVENTPPSQMTGVWVDLIRQWLKDNKVSVDGAAVQDLRKGLSELSGMSAPFTKKGTQ